MSTARPDYKIAEIKQIMRSGDVWVREFTVGVDEEVPWHRHTQVEDHCYGLEGLVRVQSAAPGGKAEDFTLRPGEKCVLPAGTAHRLTAAGGARARYLLVQKGEYDFVTVAAPV